MLHVHHGSTEGYVQHCLHAGNQADKRASIWNITDHHGKWKERACELHTDSYSFPQEVIMQSLLLISLAKVNHSTVPNIKTWKENEKNLQIALMMTSGFVCFFSFSSYSRTLILTRFVVTNWCRQCPHMSMSPC